VHLSDDPAEHFKRLTLPVVTLGFGAAAILTRLTRSSVLEVLGQDYIRTARSKGITEAATMRRHALRNALIPVLTMAGIQVGHLLGGAIIVETIFTMPGLGSYLIEAVRARDYPVIQALVLMLTTIFVLVNLFVDVLYAYLDPRIRYT
jgi:peptide/nickel transport system permease protein